MHIPTAPLVFLLAALAILLHPAAAASAAAGDNATTADAVGTYLVVVCRANGPKENGDKLREWHASLLASLLNTSAGAILEEARSPEGGQLVYSYQHVVSGFAARLTRPQLDELRRLNWCVEAIPDVMYRLRTTYTPALLGVSTPRTGMWAAARSMGDGVIVGVIDNGIDPRHAAYADEGMAPPPAKWRGRCEFAGGAPCNRKLIGGRSEKMGEHGTHTSSTAVGNFVADVKFLRKNVGVASGMAPRAHLASYEVCFEDTCPSTKQLIAIEQGAFVDGVDVVSISAGDDTQKPFYQDLTAVGSFSAVMSGVFVSTSAGNAGPDYATVTNCAPWVLTVAASTMTRRVVSRVKLGNRLVFKGEVNRRYKAVKSASLVFVSGVFEEGALKAFDVRGKIVFCDRTESPSMRGEMVRAAGGAGIIFFNDEDEGGATRFVGNNVTIPAARVSQADGIRIMKYINSTANPTASLHFGGVVLDPAYQPAIAEYSSRGPCNMSSLGVLKPDITGPGSNIIAAVPGAGNATGAPSRTFGLMSGTSMAAPHLSGIAAVLKGARPGWSPSAIKSAMMTTADVAHPDGTAVTDEITGLPAEHLLMGSGIVNPAKALDPGLVYDLSTQDYLRYICGLGYNDSFVNDIIAQPLRNMSCASSGKIEGKDLNYPSFLVTLTAAAPAVEVRRTVTNVGEAGSVYTAEVVAPKTVGVEVVPPRLVFGTANQKLDFTVRFRRVGNPVGRTGTVEGSLRWVSGKYSVRSPIVVLDGTVKLV